MIVVDVNILVYALTDSPQRELANLARRREGDWRAPVLWRHEFLNVIATLIRHGHIEPEDGPRLWENAVALLGGGEHEVSMGDALKLAVEHNISAYDAQYVALSKELRTLLITEDRGLLRKFPETCASLKAYAET